MTTKFLLIDDEPSAESYTARLADAHDDLVINPVEERDPRDIESLVEKEKADGLLIDLQLTRSMGKAKERFKVEGTSLAQEFRTKSNSVSALSIPMVSLSQAGRREALVGKDTTASDLFDAELSKSDISGHASEIAKLLIDLAKGYRKLGGLIPFGSGPWAKALTLSNADYEGIDARVQRDLEAISERPIHNIAGFFLHVLLPFSGPLIDEAMLAVRIGVDPEKSGRDWQALLSEIPAKARYKGVFSDVHSLWWMTFVNKWWLSKKDVPGPLAMLPAKERVEFLKKRFELRNLTAVEAPTGSPGARFWTVCVRTGLPVDPPEGYAIADDEQMRSWHDKRYLCRKAALRYIQDYVFEPGEKERLAKFGRASRK